MTPFAHTAGSYLAAELAAKLMPYAGINEPTVLLTAVIAGNLPDLDMFFVKGGSLKHRNTITHTPIFWIIFCSLFIIISTFINHYIFINAFAFTIGVFTHLFLDWFAARGDGVGGIRLLYPWSKKHYGFHKLKKLPNYVVKNFKFSKYLFTYYWKDGLLFYSEILVILAGMGLFIANVPEYVKYFLK